MSDSEDCSLNTGDRSPREPGTLISCSRQSPRENDDPVDPADDPQVGLCIAVALRLRNGPLSAAHELSASSGVVDASEPEYPLIDAIDDCLGEDCLELTGP